MNSILGN